MTKLIVVVAVVALLTAGIGAGGAIMLLGGKAAPPPVAAEDATGEGGEAAAGAAVAPAEGAGEAVYVDLAPSFVVNFQDASGRSRFLKVDVNAMTRSDDVGDALNKHLPNIRNSLVMLFSKQIYEQLMTDEGKLQLRKDALAEIQTVLKKEQVVGGVEDVLFTSFVVQ
ncbi:MAG: flagellar basal body-associated FliL family protein [Gammaproteobacteria bacterium]|nr:flagellar basal body-associated FliL family protein [Gammaproteobacteria bacterium]